VLVIGLCCSIITTMFALGFKRAFVAWLVTLLSSAVVFLIAIISVRTLVEEPQLVTSIRFAGLGICC